MSGDSKEKDNNENSCTSQEKKNIKNIDNLNYKFYRMKQETSIYVIKLIAYLGITALTIITSVPTRTLMIGTFVFLVGILFDMIILSKRQTGPSRLVIQKIQFIALILIVLLLVLVIVCLVSSEVELNKGLIQLIIFCGNVGPLLEIIYNYPEDD